MNKNPKLRKALTLILCAVALIAISVGATIAYLTDHASVQNTFTVGHVDITLTEAKTNAKGQPLKGETVVALDQADRITGNNEDKFTLWRKLRIMGNCFTQCRTHHFFVELGQFPAQTDRPVCTEDLCHTLKGCGKLVGGFVEDHCSLLIFQCFQMLRAALPSSR